MAAPPNVVELLTPGDVAAALKVSQRTVERMRRRGEIPFVRIGRQVRFRADDLAAYLARRVAASPPQPQRPRRARRTAAGVVVPFTRLSR